MGEDGEKSLEITACQYLSDFHLYYLVLFDLVSIFQQQRKAEFSHRKADFLTSRADGRDISKRYHPD